MPDSAGTAAWTTDSAAFFYVKVDELHRPLKVFRHRLSTPTSDDVLVFESTNPNFFVSLTDLQAGRYAQISVHDHDTSECWLLDLADPSANPALVTLRRPDISLRRRTSSGLPRHIRIDHPYRRRQGGGFQDCLDAGGNAVRRNTGRISSRTGRASMCLR